MRKVVLMMVALLIAGATFGQLSGSYIIPIDFPTIDAAITALNNQGVAGSGVTFNVAAGLIDSTTSASVLTTSGRASGYIIFQKIGTGDNPKIVRKDAGSLATSTLGGQGDAVMIFQGADYVTFDGIDITTINSGIEYGYMFRKIDGNDGCKFINIKNCNITMTKGTVAYVTGIYVSNLDALSPVNANTGILVQSTAGRNENISITGNTIGNVVTGIHLRGFNDPAAPWAFYDQNITVGGTAVNGNVIRNFGGGSTSTAYGIYSQYNANFNYSYNTFNNTGGGGTNATSTLYSIYNPSSGALSGGTVYINNNTFQLGMSSASAMYPIYNAQSCNSVEISGNTFGFSNTFASTTVYLIYNSNTSTNNTISYNSTTGTISKTGSGTFYGYYNFGSAVNGLSTISNNNFSNITLTGTSAFIGIQSATSATHTQDIYSNIISNVTAGSGTSYGIYCYYGLLNNIYINQVNMFSGGGTLYGIQSGGSSSVTCNTHDNTINNLSTTGTSSGVHGIYATVATTNSIYNNRIFNISAGGTTGTAAGITGLSGTTLNFYNNFISDIKAPNSSGANVVNGINITGGTTANVFNNTVFLNATGSGAIFGSSAIYAVSTVGLDLRNNILVNKSTRNGNTGFTVGLRRNAAYNATFYLAGSNTNDLYVPVANWNYLFFDGVAGTAGRDSTISMFKTRVAPRDAGSFSEDPPFINATTTPYDLHLQTILTKCESGATPVSSPVAINTDFDGQPRYPNPGYPENLSYPATAPDVGADEFAGQPSFTCEQPNPGNTVSTFNNICWGKSIVLSLQSPPVGTGNTYQWQTSPDGAVYSNISGANASTYGLTPVTHAWYRCYIVCQNGNLSAYSNPIHIVFANEITSTNSPVERCGVGSVNLEAVASGGTVTWYTSQTGGEPIGTGSPFSSPPITGNTTFWVGADDIAPQETVGRSAPAVTTGTTLSNYGLVFNALSDIVLNAVDVYPVSTAGNMNVAVYNSSQVLVAGPLAIPFPTGNGATPFTATLNFNVPQGTGYRLVITSMSGGSLVRESASISYPYSSANVSITNGATSLTGTTSTSYYWFYNIKATGGCQSVRVPVVADVVSPPDIMVSNDATVCNDIISELTVVSNPALFDLYVWSPVTHLFTDPGCTIPYTGTNSMTVYVRTNIADEYHYTCTGTNTVTQCANTDEVVVAILPENPEITSIPDSLCQGGIATMTVNFPSSYGDATFQWQESVDGLSFSDIDGATNLSYTTPYLGATTYYQIIIRNGEGEYCAVPLYTMVVSNPVITSTTPGFHCGPGVVQLAATGTSATLKWYDNPNGGTPVGSGSPFTTPYLTETKTYYVSTVEPGTILESGGKLTPAGTAGAMANFYGMVFNANDYIMLQSVDVYPTSTAGQCGVSLYNSSQQLLAGPFYFSFPAGNGSTPYTIPLNLNIPAGTGYRLLITAMLGGNLKYESSGVTFPINNGTLVSMTAAATSLTAQSTTTYRWFYNWRVMHGCASPLIPVLATINLAPVYEVTPDQAVCNDQVATIAVTNGTAYYDSFTWTPVNNLFTDAACTTPYTAGTIAQTVYMKTATAGNYAYTGHALNTVNECNTTMTTHVVNLPTAITITADPDTVCVSDDVTLTILPAMDYTGSRIQWQSSPDGVAYSNISGATNATYDAGFISTTTWYRVTIQNSNLIQCLSADYKLYVNNPAILSTTPGTRCGEGTVLLGATSTPGATINWYNAAFGGTLLGNGPSFTTPVINATTSYFVNASSGGSVAFVGKTGIDPNASNGGGSTTYMTFTALTPFTLKTVDLFPYGTGPGTVTIVLRTSTGTDIMSKTFDVTGTTNTSAPAQRVTLDFDIPGPGGYRLGIGGWTGGVTNLYRDYTGSTSTFFPYPYTVPNTMEITGNSLGNYYYYFFYNWQVTSGCSGLMTEVVATVIPAIPLNITPNRTICVDEVLQLTVTSSLSAYDVYTWSPAVDIYTDAACTMPYIGNTNYSTVYFKRSAGGDATYTCSAYNSVTDCNSEAEMTVSVIPSAVISATPENICVSGSTLLSLEPSTGYGAATFQWQDSPDNVVFTSISGATDNFYQTPVLTANAYYRVQIRNSFGVLCSEPGITINVNSPQLLTTIPAERCGPGTVTLTATANPGATINWYTGSTGGLPVGSGNSFVTPVLTSTTSFFAGATQGVTSGAVGPLTNGIGAGAASALTYYTSFDVLASSMTLYGVYVYPGAAGNVRFYLATSDGTMLDTITHAVTTSDVGQKTYIPVGYTFPNGNGYRIGYNTGLSGVSMYRNTAGAVYPYTLPGVVSITGNNFNVVYYYYFYDWQVSKPCESARQEVLASVFPAPPLTITGSKSICVDEIYPLTITSELTNFDVYTWSPVTNLFTDAACTVPYVENTNASTVYVKAAAGVTTSYTCSSLNNTTLCTNLASTIITVIPQAAVVSYPESICFSGSATLSLSPESGFGLATFQWQDSPDNVTFTDISGATNQTYATTSISATRYYKAIIRNEAGAVCSEPVYTLTVHQPALTSTTPGTRCGVGTVDLSATATGGTVNWYGSATGGLLLGSGNTFTTPVISATTNYYAEAVAPGSQSFSVGMVNSENGTSGVGLNTYGLYFDALSAFTLNSVKVYPNATTNGAAGTVTISVINASGTVLNQAVVDVVGYIQSSNPTSQVVYPNFQILPGTGLRLVMTAKSSNISGLMFQPSAQGPYPYPYTVPGVVSITSGTYSGTVYPSLYYYFYDWNVTVGCTSARTMVTATVTAPPAINPPTATPSAVCAASPSVLEVTSAHPDYTYIWMPGNLSGATQTVNPEVTTQYTVTASDAFTGCVNVGTVTVGILPTPSVLTVTPETALINEGDIQSLSASGGTLSGTMTFGTGTSTNTTTGYPAPYTNYYGGTKHQMLIRASELLSAGLFAGAPIHSVTFTVTAVGASFGGVLNNFQIDMGHTTSTVLTSSAFIGGLTNVYPAQSQAVAVGTVTHTFAVPFIWNGTDNLVIQTSYSNANAGTSAYAVQMTNSDPGFVSTNWYRVDSQSATAVLAATTPTSSGNARPNMVFGYSSPTTFAWTPVTDLYSDAAATIPYAGESIAMVYAKPYAPTTYTVTSTSTLTGCTRMTSSFIDVLPLCQPPVGVNVSGITATGATLGWTEPTLIPTNGYEYEIRTSGAPGSGATGLAASGAVAAGVTSANITGLTSLTDYHAYVRSNCGDGVYSLWTADVPFTTLQGIPENLTVSGVIAPPADTCFNATNTITVGGNPPTFTIQSGASATFIAGQKIIYLPGTIVESGAYMHGYITLDNTYCGGVIPPIVAVVTGNPESPAGLDLIGFSLYPNPTSGDFTIVQKEGKLRGEVKVEVFSVKGEKVISEKMIGEKQHIFRFSEMQSGLYFVKIMSEDHVETIKLVKTR